MIVLNEQQQSVFLDRYALKAGDGMTPVETTVDEMWDRVAMAIGDDDNERAAFRNLLGAFKFVPGGRILSGAGTYEMEENEAGEWHIVLDKPLEVTYYNCFVIPIETKDSRIMRELEDVPSYQYAGAGCDSREAIFDTLQVMVDIMSRGGGVGINWSTLRPMGAHLKRVNGTTSGPVSWMDVASQAVGTVTQGGSRRGAAMFMLNDWHPDIINFITAKGDLSRITNANVSVAISDAFMSAVKDDAEWTLRFPDTTDSRYNSKWDGDLREWEECGLPVVVYKTLPARELWEAICFSAWDNGEPGIVFLDRYNDLRTVKEEQIICVNPCGEQGLGAYSVCNLGSMNLAAYLSPFGPEHVDGVNGFDFGRFRSDVRTAIRFLDRVIDKSHYFLPENEDRQKTIRRVGLGVMGLADALIGLRLRYGSKEAVEWTEYVFSEMKHAALRESIALANRFGPAPAWSETMIDEAPYLADATVTQVDEMERSGLRNLYLLTQAPTGSTSMLAGVNSGIEPYFAFEYTRQDRLGTRKVFAPVVAAYRIAQGHEGMPIAQLPPLPDYFVTAQDVTVEEHIAMQAAVQKYVDSSVSKTINAPNSHTVDDVEKAYMLAYDSGLKGVAYFRDGCGRAQVLTREEPEREPHAEYDKLLLDTIAVQADRLKQLDSSVKATREARLVGATTKVSTAGGNAYVVVNRDSADEPHEVFVLVGKAGSDLMTMGEALGRLISLALQEGAPLSLIADKLEGIGGYQRFNPSLPTAVGRVLRDEAQGKDKDEEPSPSYHGTVTDALGSVIIVYDDTPETEAETSTVNTGKLCPDCGSFAVVREEGCNKCHVCGFSAC